jgi:hypothetical protein
MTSRTERMGKLLSGAAVGSADPFHVGEDEVWEWVDKERRKPTADIMQPS